MFSSSGLSIASCTNGKRGKVPYFHGSHNFLHGAVESHDLLTLIVLRNQEVLQIAMKGKIVLTSVCGTKLIHQTISIFLRKNIPFLSPKISPGTQNSTPHQE